MATAAAAAAWKAKAAAVGGAAAVECAAAVDVHPGGYDEIARVPGGAGGEHGGQTGSSGAAVHGTARAEGAEDAGDADHGGRVVVAAAAYGAAAGPRGSKKSEKSARIGGHQDDASLGWGWVASRARACASVHGLCAESSYPGEGTQEKVSGNGPSHLGDTEGADHHDHSPSSESESDQTLLPGSSLECPFVKGPRRMCGYDRGCGGSVVPHRHWDHEGLASIPEVAVAGGAGGDGVR